MGLTRWVADAAVKRVHVMIIEAPGSALLRMRTEAAATARGWVVASSPANTDALLICGVPSKTLAGLIDAVWGQIPAPRVRATVPDAPDLPSILDAVPDDLRDTGVQRARAGTVSTNTQPAASTRTMDMDHSGHDMYHSGHDMEHSGHDMDMTGPGGIPLAEGSVDRDGLEMDATHLTLGPISADWPAMLSLHCTLHGDVVAEAAVEWLTVDEVPAASARDDAARLCDSAARVLAVAGWGPMAARSRRVRNDILGDVPLDEIRSRLATLTRRLEHSKTLAWSTEGIVVPEAGSPRDALIGWLRTCRSLIDSPTPPPTDQMLHPLDKAATGELIRAAVVGQELSTVRLIVASLGVEHAISRAQVPHG